jgi:hypothetical protein
VRARIAWLQVEVAKKIMFEQQKDEALPRKNSRRETWCPGRSAWAPPPLPGMSGDGSGRRKRPLHSLAALDEDASSALLPVIGEEGDAEQPAQKNARHSSAAGAAGGDRVALSNHRTVCVCAALDGAAAESRPTDDAEDSLDEGLPQLPTSVHVRKSSMAGGKVGWLVRVQTHACRGRWQVGVDLQRAAQQPKHTLLPPLLLARARAHTPDGQRAAGDAAGPCCGA